MNEELSNNNCSDRLSEEEQDSDIVCSAPGKVILHGEHAVVYGKSALAVSIDIHTTVHIKLGGKDVHLKLNNLNDDHIWPFSSFEGLKLIDPIDSNGKMPDNFEYKEELLQKIKPFIDDMHFDAFYPYGHDNHELYTKEKTKANETKFSIQQINNSLKAFLLLYLGISDYYCNSKHVPLRVTVMSSLPCSAGLGSSSAYTVSLTAALFQAYNIKVSKQIISDWAFQIDKLFHGKPSGIDNSICTFGGALLFSNGKIQEQCSKLPKIQLVIVNTKVSRNTKILVQKAREQFDKYPSIFNHILSAIDELSKTAWSFFSKTNQITTFSSLKELFKINQLLLETLNVSHPTIDNICSIASKYNFSAKLTGAGGGGSVIILVDDNSGDSVEKLINELEDTGFDYWKVEAGCPGVSNK